MYLQKSRTRNVAQCYHVLAWCIQAPGFNLIFVYVGGGGDLSYDFISCSKINSKWNLKSRCFEHCIFFTHLQMLECLDFRLQIFIFQKTMQIFQNQTLRYFVNFITQNHLGEVSKREWGGGWLFIMLIEVGRPSGQAAPLLGSGSCTFRRKLAEQ